MAPPDEAEPQPARSDNRDDPTLGAREILLNLRNLRRMRVDDVSVPRPEIVAVPESAALDDVVAAFQASTLSRLVVYGEDLDDPLGFVHLKDLALKYGFGAAGEPFDLRGLVRQALYVPPSMPIGELLQKMQSARLHMALVIDEHGGVDGLVTIEDLLEQLVGDIDDEHDEDEGELWTREGPDVYEASAGVDLDEFEQAIGAELSDPRHADEADTLGGVVIRLSGRVPEIGELVVHPAGHQFEVLDADARKIKRVRVRLNRHLHDEAAGAAAL